MSFRRSPLSITALGFQYSTWAARLPALTDRPHLSSAEVGFLLLAGGMGAVASSPLVSRLMPASAVTSLTESVLLHFTVAGAVLLALVFAARPDLLKHRLPVPSKPDGDRRRVRSSAGVWLGLAILLTGGAVSRAGRLGLHGPRHGGGSSRHV